MKVNFYATLRRIAGQKTVEFELSQDTSVKELLELVLVRFPEMRKELVDTDGNLFGHVHFFVNGRDSRFLENDIATLIQPGDKIDIFPAVGGGSDLLSIKINFYASLRKIAGTKEVEFPIGQDSTVQDLLQDIISRYPVMRSKLLDRNGDLDRHAHIYVNGRNCPLLVNGLDSTLAINDVVDVFPIGHF